MATEKQIAANQRNAKHSHGPISEEGSIEAALNNFRHGLAVKTNEHFGILHDENSDKFEELLSSLQKEHAPTNPTETLLVRRMAQYEWLRARALRFQSDCLQYGVKNVESIKVALFIRYQTTHERAFYRALNELQSIREQKRKSEIGFESQQLKQAAEIRAAESQNLKREEFHFKKDIFQLNKQAQEQRKVETVVPQTAPSGLEQAA
jgi:hypothetical protein